MALRLAAACLSALAGARLLPEAAPPQLRATAAASSTARSPPAGAAATAAALSAEMNATGSARRTRATVLPTTCPADMPPDDPFWAQESTGYALDSHRNASHCHPAPCSQNPTNGQRLAALRRLAKVTDVLLTTHNIDYTITSGTLIGVQRCNDVVPWDGDVDVQILESDKGKLEALFDSLATNVERHRILDFIGFPTLVLLGFPTMQGHGGSCFPWRITDMETGYYADIFVPVLVKVSQWMEYSRRPIHTGKVYCDPGTLYTAWPGPPRECPWRTCDSTPTSAIWPSRRCRFADFEVNCPADNAAYLRHIYGFSVDKPDVPIRDDP